MEHIFFYRYETKIENYCFFFFQCDEVFDFFDKIVNLFINNLNIATDKINNRSKKKIVN